jgi:hypothetical protein
MMIGRKLFKEVAVNNARLMIFLNSDETDALLRASEEDYRTPREQIRWILRTELTRRGLLKQDNQPNNAVNNGNKDSSG